MKNFLKYKRDKRNSRKDFIYKRKKESKELIREKRNRNIQQKTLLNYVKSIEKIMTEMEKTMKRRM